jgi:hypothetical protein
MSHKPLFNPNAVMTFAGCVLVLVLVVIRTSYSQPIVATRGYALSHKTAQPVGNHADVQNVGGLSRAKVPGRQREQINKEAPVDPLFQAAVPFDPGGIFPQALAIGDVNGDGNPDLLTANQCSTDMNCEAGSIGVLLGKGDGTFRPATVYPSGGYSPRAIQISDVNGDGKPDVIVANYCSNCEGGDVSGVVGVLLGNGDGTFQQPLKTSSGAVMALALAAGDLNRDGKMDIVVAHQCAKVPDCGDGPVIGILFGNGDGSFQPAAMYDSRGQFPTSIALADFNGDHNLDLEMLDSSVIAVALGNGDGTFQVPSTYRSGTYSVAVAIGDINQDQQLDLVVANIYCYYGCITLLLGNGDGTFQPALTFSTPGPTVGVAVADVDGNGINDILVVIPSYPNEGSDDVMGVLLGNADGTFQPTLVFSTNGVNWVQFAVADLNRDGRPDIATTAPTILFNNTGPHDSTSTTITSSPNPSVHGQPVTFTAVVRSDAGTPTGTVAILDNSYSIGSAVLVNGSASLTYSWPYSSAGSHSITAQYQGSLKFGVSESAPLIQIIQSAKTTTSLTSSPDPSRAGRPVRYTAMVTSQYGGYIDGVLNFSDEGVPIGSRNPSHGPVYIDVRYSVPGIHSIVAQYLGNQDNDPSTSQTLTQYVQGPTKTVVSTSASRAFVGQSVTFTATVTSPYGGIPNGDLVTFYDGATTLGSVALAGGVARYTTSSLSVKTHYIKATYAGDPTFISSHGTLWQVVGKFSTTAILSSTPNPSVSGEAVTFTAVVSSAAPEATGKVTFKDGTTPMGSVVLSGGVATLTKSKLAVGTHPITAQYLGDGANSKSKSSVVDQVVR